MKVLFCKAGMPNIRIITSVIGRAQRGIGRAQVNIGRASALPGLYKTTLVPKIIHFEPDRVYWLSFTTLDKRASPARTGGGRAAAAPLLSHDIPAARCQDVRAGRREQWDSGGETHPPLLIHASTELSEGHQRPGQRGAPAAGHPFICTRRHDNANCQWDGAERVPLRLNITSACGAGISRIAEGSALRGIWTE